MDFQIGDKVYAGDWIYGTIVDIDGDEARIEFDTLGGGGTISYPIDELELAPVQD